MKKIVLSTLAILLATFIIPTPAEASTVADFTVQVTDTDSNPISSGIYRWESIDQTTKSNATYKSDINGSFVISGAPAIVGHLVLASPVWVTGDIKMITWKSQNFTFGSDQIVKVRVPKKVKVTVTAQMADSTPLPNTKVSWYGSSDLSGSFNYFGPNSIDEMEPNDALTDYFGSSSAVVLEASRYTISIAACRNGAVNYTAAYCKSSIGIRWFIYNSRCYRFQTVATSSSPSVAEAPSQNLCNSNSWVVTGTDDWSDLPVTVTASLKYNDGNVTETHETNGSTVVVFNNVSKAAISFSQVEVTKGSPLSVLVATSAEKQRKSFAAEVFDPSGKSLKTCLAKTSKTTFTNLKVASISVCPQISGVYKVKTMGIAGATSAFVKVRNSAPTIIRDLTIPPMQVHKSLNISFGLPEYDGGAGVTKLTYTVTCGTKKLSGTKSISFVDGLANVTVSKIPGIGRCNLAAGLVNRFGVSPFASQYYLQR